MPTLTARELLAVLDAAVTAPVKAAAELMHAHTVHRARRNPAYTQLDTRNPWTGDPTTGAGAPVTVSHDELREHLHLLEQQELLEQHSSINWRVENAIRTAAHSTPATSLVRHIAWGYQRFTRGWDDRATWSLDVHLTRTLGQQLAHLADTSHGWPDTITDTYEEWAALLREHSAVLLRYADNVYTMDSVDDDTITAARASLVWVAEHLPHLWD